MVGLGEVLGGAANLAQIAQGAGSISNAAKASSSKGPLSGARLGYDVMGARVLIKESIANWLDLKPAAPAYGKFGSGNSAIGGVVANAVNAVNSGNIGAVYVKRGGFRYQSFTFLVEPGTKIKEPVPGCQENKFRDHLVCSFTIGFPRGGKGNRITVSRVIQWIRRSKRRNDIYGLITPSGTKHQWRGRLTDDGGAIPDVLGDSFDLLKQSAELLF